jgi:hypothetical protein
MDASHLYRFESQLSWICTGPRDGADHASPHPCLPTLIRDQRSALIQLFVAEILIELGPAIFVEEGGPRRVTVVFIPPRVRQLVPHRLGLMNTGNSGRVDRSRAD